MRIAVVCLTIACLCAGCWNAEGSGSGNAQTLAGIGKMMKDYYRGTYEFEASGPFTCAQVESQLREAFERGREAGHVEQFDDAPQAKDLTRLKGLQRDGDELYFFESDEASWRALAGISGFVLVRKNRIVSVMATGYN